MNRIQINALIDVLLTIPGLDPEVAALLRAMRASDGIDITRAAAALSEACTEAQARLGAGR